MHACDHLSNFLLPIQPAQRSVCEIIIRTNSHKWILIMIIKRHETLISMDSMVHNYANNVFSTLLVVLYYSRTFLYSPPTLTDINRVYKRD